MVGKTTRTVLLLTAALALAGCFRSPAERERSFLQTGREYCEKKDYARAILQFKNAAQAMPNDAQPYYELGQAYLASGDVLTAFANFRKAVELNPALVPAQLKMAEALSTNPDKDSLEDAEKRLQGVLTHSPGNIDALDMLGLTEWKLGKRENAEKHFLEAMAKAPADLKASVGLAQIKLAQRDLQGAEEVLRRAAAQTPPTAGPFNVLGEFYLLSGKPDKAAEQFRRVLEIDPENGPALRELAGLEVRAGRMDQAERMYRKVSSLPDKANRPLHAIFLFQTGKRDQAVAEFEKLAKDDPEDRGARNRLVFAYLATGRAADAERVLTAALRKNPRDADALLQRSEIYLMHAKAAEAQSDLMQVLSLQPDAAVAHYLLARVYEARNQTLNQRQELNDALRLNPDLLTARIELARLLIRTHAAEAALEMMDAAPRQQKRDPAFIVERNWALRALGDQAGMRGGVDTGLAIARTPDLLLQDALLKLDQKNYTGARASLDEILKNNPRDVRALDVMARTWLAQKDPAAAVRTIRESVSRYPDSAPLQLLLGQLLLVGGDRAQARAAFEAAKTADPAYTQADLALARLDIAENRLKEAGASLSAALSQTPGDFSALLAMGSVEERLGNRAAALQYYRKAVDVQPNNVTALNNLAYTLADFANDPDTALKFAQHAEELAPDDPAVEDTLGWVLYKKGMYSNAVPHLENSVARAPTARRKLHLAMAYLKLGDTTRGRKTLQAAINMNPNLPEAESARRLLRYR